MGPMTIILVMAGTATVGVALYWGGGPAASIIDFFKSNSEKYLKPTWDRFWGNRPKKTSVIRLPDEEGKIVLNFIDIVADIDAIPPYSYYDAKLFINKADVTLGEVDFCKWERRPGFKVIITPKGKPNEPLAENNPARTQILNNLRKYAKVTIASGLMPDQVLKEVITVTHGGLGIVDFFNGFLGKIVKQEFDPLVSQEALLKQPNFLAAVNSLAEQNPEIGVGYYTALEGSLERALKAAEDEKKNLEQKIKARESQIALEKRNFWKWFAIITISIFVVLGASYLLLGVAGLKLVFDLVFLALGSVGSIIFSGFFTLGLTALAVGIIKKFIPEFKKRNQDIAEGKLKKYKEEINRLNKELVSVKGEKEKWNKREAAFQAQPLIRLRRYLEEGNIAAFVEEYKRNDANIFSPLDPRDRQLIHEIVLKDFGNKIPTATWPLSLLGGCGVKLNCANLQKLDERHRTTLLEVCFGDSNKAILAAKVLDLLFNNEYQVIREKPIFQKIVCAVYDVLNKPVEPFKGILDANEDIRIKERGSIETFSQLETKLTNSLESLLSAEEPEKINFRLEEKSHLQPQVQPRKTPKQQLPTLRSSQESSTDSDSGKPGAHGS